MNSYLDLEESVQHIGDELRALEQDIELQQQQLGMHPGQSNYNPLGHQDVHTGTSQNKVKIQEAS